MKKILYFITLCTLLFVLSACEVTKKIELSYDNSEIQVTVGDTINLKPSISGLNETDIFNLNYDLSNDNATIDKDGNFTALSEGDVVVTVTIDLDVNVSATVTVIINGEETFNIILDVNGGEALSSSIITFKKDEIVTLPTPMKEGYTFLGWYEDNTLVTNIENKNYDLVAKWEKVIVTYTITLDANGGEGLSSNCITFNENETVTLPTLTKEGYTFLGWYEDDTLVTTVTNKNYTLVAKWEKVIVTYTIILDVNGGEGLSSNCITFNENETVTLPTPTKEGHTFLGWYENDNLITNIENKNYNLVAKWEKIPTYTITLDPDGGSGVSNTTITFLKDNNVTLPTPTKNGYKFLGWYENGVLVKTIENKDYDLIAKWEKNIVTYTIKLDVNGGNALSSNQITFEENNKVTLPTPTRSGYKFLGWYENNTLVTTITNKNYNLVAKWEKIIVSVTQYSINYVLQEDTYLSNYTSRTELINDLISDIQSVKGDSYSLSYFTSYTGSGYGIFASSAGVKTFFSNDEMRIKWSWILEYAKTLRAASELDVTQYDTLISKGYVDADAATVNLEMIGFICGKQCSYTAGNTTYKSSDYSLSGNLNGIWGMIHDQFMTNNKFDQGTYLINVLPNAVKVGATFAGWYTSSTFDASTKVNSTTVLNGNINVYPKFTTASSVSTTVTFDYNGGVSEQLYEKYGTKLSSLVTSGLNGSFWSGTNYASNIFINESSTDPLAKFSTRIYISEDSYTGLYTIVSILQSGTASTWPENAEYVITISGQYSGSYDDNFTASKINIGDIVIVDKQISSMTSSTIANVSIYSPTLSKDTIVEVIDGNFILPSPKRTGYSFDGWYDAYNNKYDSIADFSGISSITLTANWIFEDRIIGEFEDVSYVIVGKTIQLNTIYLSGNTGNLKWTSETPNIATVNSIGTVTGVSEGLAKIVVSDANYPSINFVFYVTVLNEDPTGILKLLVDSNNASIYTKEDLLIGIKLGSDGAYITDITGSVSKLLFENYVVHNDYYLSSPSNKSTLTGSGKGGVDFITVHYAADMPYSASASLTGGKNLASYNKTCNTNGTGASWHYSTGNDGIWSCQNTAYGAWHAGRSTSMTWTSSGVTTAKVGTDVYSTDVTLGSDGYFYIKGVKTSVKNSTSGKKLNGMGLGVKLVGSTWYLGGHQYKSDYGYIGSTGGNNNSIGMETSVRQGSDLWLTWQYTAQLCAKLLIQFELPIQRLVGHHFFSGKWCPQPMLENDLEIWYEFVEMVEQELELYKNYSNYTLDFSSNSSYLKNNGRVKTLPTYSECVTYTVTYKVGSTTKTVTLSSILPGSIA